ncbi:hypothetical protein C8R43DRAFT_947562 [Mycena crocata]|nr:hypothetical protein C8R43DRAFT_947562 [Mycena crocata]
MLHIHVAERFHKARQCRRRVRGVVASDGARWGSRCVIKMCPIITKPSLFGNIMGFWQRNLLWIMGICGRMGFATIFPAHRHGYIKKSWVLRDYGFSGVWVTRGLTVTNGQDYDSFGILLSPIEWKMHRLGADRMVPLMANELHIGTGKIFGLQIIRRRVLWAIRILCGTVTILALFAAWHSLIQSSPADCTCKMGLVPLANLVLPMRSYKDNLWPEKKYITPWGSRPSDKMLHSTFIVSNSPVVGRERTRLKVSPASWIHTGLLKLLAVPSGGLSGWPRNTFAGRSVCEWMTQYRQHNNFKDCCEEGPTPEECFALRPRSPGGCMKSRRRLSSESVST